MYCESRYLCWEVNRANRVILCSTHKFPPRSLLMLRMRSTKLHADSLLNYFRRKDVKDKGPEPGGELPKEVVESTNFYTRPGCECH